MRKTGFFYTDTYTCTHRDTLTHFRACSLRGTQRVDGSELFRPRAHLHSAGWSPAMHGYNSIAVDLSLLQKLTGWLTGGVYQGLLPFKRLPTCHQAEPGWHLPDSTQESGICRQGSLCRGLSRYFVSFPRSLLDGRGWSRSLVDMTGSEDKACGDWFYFIVYLSFLSLIRVF